MFIELMIKTFSETINGTFSEIMIGTMVGTILGLYIYIGFGFVNGYALKI